MVSQVLSTVLDGRPLIWTWPIWLDFLWIAIWSVTGGLLVLLLRLSLQSGLIGLAIIGTCSAFATLP